jgi:rRNA small subunit pseudouridine methyltransferase Nep1
MSLLETPLCKEGLLRIHLHLQDGRIVEVNPDVRLPRNYDRFVGLIEQLLLKGQVPPQGNSLLHFIEGSIEELITEVRVGAENAMTILAIEGGDQTSVEKLREILSQDQSTPVIVGVGAFPHGNLSEEIASLFDTHLELDTDVMMAWHVCAELMWIYSLAIEVVKARYSAT